MGYKTARLVDKGAAPIAVGIGLPVSESQERAFLTSGNGTELYVINIAASNPVHLGLSIGVIDRGRRLSNHCQLCLLA